MSKKAKRTNSSKRKRRFVPNCKCDDIDSYVKDVLKNRIKASEEVKQQCEIILREFRSKRIEVDLELYDKYIRIGFLFFKELYPWQRFATAIALCTFYKGTKEPRWNKALIVVGRGNGKDGMIAWWSVCLTSKYHGIRNYDVDIIANSMEQSLRPINDITEMVQMRGKKRLLVRKGDSIISTATRSNITARSSDASVQDGLRSGAVIFNELHEYRNYEKIDVMVSGLGKIDDPRTLYFSTNGKVRGGPFDDMIETGQEVLRGNKKDSGTLYLVYKLKNKAQAHDPENWVIANPSLPYRKTLAKETADEYEKWKERPNAFMAFPQKRMNLSEMPVDQEVVPWEVIEKTGRPFKLEELQGKACILGIDLSKTTDWTAINFLFYDEERDQFICYNHAFVCEGNRDLSGIKANWKQWVEQGLLSLIQSKLIEPEMVVDNAMKMAEENGWNVIHVVIDDYKKAILKAALEKYDFSKENGNLTMVRPSNIAQALPNIERYFINEKFVFGNNRMLMWATNNTKVIPWKKSTTGDADLGNQIYAKINPRFRKNDPFMAFVHSFVEAERLTGAVSLESMAAFRGV